MSAPGENGRCAVAGKEIGPGFLRLSECGRDKVMPDDRSSKNKAIEVALTQIEKQFGKGSIMRLGDRSDPTGVQAISTGAISFDAALGVGGFPKGRVVEIYGPESSGKTTIALHAIAQAQKVGGSAVFIDAEHAMDAKYANMLGV